MNFNVTEKLVSSDEAFVVEETYQGKGIASLILQMLIMVARGKGLVGFTADIIANNQAIFKTYEKAGLPIQAVMEYGIYHLTMPFTDLPSGNP